MNMIMINDVLNRRKESKEPIHDLLLGQ